MMSEAPNSSLCFYQTVRAYSDHQISLEGHIRNVLAHIFAGVRHGPLEEITEEKVIYWMTRDALIAAVHVCMLQGDLQLLVDHSDLEETLVQMLLDIKDATLAGWKAIGKSASVLTVPLFYQLLVVVALENGNLNLVREMITDAPPGPSYNLFFSPEPHLSWQTFRRFADAAAAGSPSSSPQTDHGCELYTMLIRAGWAHPRGYMQQWAGLTSDVQAGIKLIETLMEHGVEVDERALFAAAAGGQLDMLEHLLSIYTPVEPAKQHVLLKGAAARPKDGAKYLDVLYRNGVRELNWMPPPPAVALNPRDARETEIPFETPLHKAAESGDPEAVEWLIRHGAQRLNNYYGQDQVQLAKAYGRDANVAVFQRYSGWALQTARKSGRCVLS